MPESHVHPLRFPSCAYVSPAQRTRREAGASFQPEQRATPTDPPYRSLSPSVRFRTRLRRPRSRLLPLPPMMAPSPMRPVDAAAAQPPPAGGGSAARFQPPLSRSASSGDYFGLTPSRAVARTPTGASSGLSGGGQASRLLWRGAFGLADGSALDGPSSSSRQVSGPHSFR